VDTVSFVRKTSSTWGLVAHISPILGYVGFRSRRWVVGAQSHTPPNPLSQRNVTRALATPPRPDLHCVRMDEQSCLPKSRQPDNAPSSKRELRYFDLCQVLAVVDFPPVSPPEPPSRLTKSHLSPYSGIFCVQLFCCRYFAPEMPPIPMKTKISGGGGGGTPISIPNWEPRYCLNTTMPSGGRFSSTDWAWPWLGMGSVSTPPKFPSSVPP
jgi:hypothetical protein